MIKWKLPQFGNSKLGYIMTRAAFRFFQLAFEYPDIELMFMVNKALKKEKGYDLLISIAVPYPIHWGVAWARTAKHPVAKIWAADCGDPYMGNDLDTFRKLFYFKYIEKWFSRKADYISIPKESFKVNFYKDFHHKIIEIPQGFRFEDVRIRELPVKNEIPTFAFAGGFIKKFRDPSVFFHFLSEIGKDFRFILYTNSSSKIHIDPFLNIMNGKVEVRDYIPRDELIAELSKMDFLVNFEYDPLIQVPSKLIDYSLTRRPVLNIISSNFNGEVVNEFLSGNYTNQFLVPDLDQYRIETVCRKFLALLSDDQ